MERRIFLSAVVPPGRSPRGFPIPTRRLISSGFRCGLRPLLVAVLLVALTPVPVVHAATFTVTTTADGTDASPGDGVCETVPGNGVDTLIDCEEWRLGAQNKKFVKTWLLSYDHRINY